MPPQDAIFLRNFIPASYGCTVRKGYVEHATGLDETVATLMTYNASDGSYKLFAVDAANIFDVTVPDDYTGVTPIAPSSYPEWQHTSFANAAGVHLLAFNGIDSGFWYGPSGYTPLVAGDGTAVGTWSGVNPEDLINTVVHQKRVWAVQRDSTLGWYLPPEQVYGVAKSFDFGGCFGKGGYLQALGTWTTDSGTGIDDKLLAISNNGEVAIYSGYDPTDPDKWRLEGVYQAGETFTRRCWTKYGGDCAILTQYGVVTMSSLLSAEESVSANTLSFKVQRLFSDLASEGQYRTGWQIIAYPAQDLLIVNIPGVNPSTNFQMVMNTITKAWATFIGMRASCWSQFESGVMFGGFKTVYRGLEGYLDGVLLDKSGGEPVRAEVQQSFSYFGAQGQNKHFKMFRPSFVYGGDFNFRARANMDYTFGGTPAPAAPTSAKYGIWDEDLWDSDAVWSGGLLSSKQWVFITGIGYAASIRMQVQTAFELTWVSTDWVYEKGGIV